MSFGDQSLTFVSVTDGPPDRNGEPTRVETDVVVPECRFRPLKTAEKVASGVADIATEVWQATCPPAQVVVDAKANDAIKYQGKVFQIIGGAQPFTDFSDVVHKVTVTAQRQS